MADKKLNIKVQAKGTKQAKKNIGGVEKGLDGITSAAVSYTHLTLPTIYSV